MASNRFPDYKKEGESKKENKGSSQMEMRIFKVNKSGKHVEIGKLVTKESEFGRIQNGNEWIKLFEPVSLLWQKPREADLTEKEIKFLSAAADQIACFPSDGSPPAKVYEIPSHSLVNQANQQNYSHPMSDVFMKILNEGSERAFSLKEITKKLMQWNSDAEFDLAFEGLTKFIFDHELIKDDYFNLGALKESFRASAVQLRGESGMYLRSL